MSKNQVTFSLEKSMLALQKSLENIAPQVEAELNSAIKDLAYATYASIVAKAQADLPFKKQAYLNSLQFTALDDNSFLISLEGDFANSMESGFPAHDMVISMLKSTKTVDIGSRSGLPWVQNTKPGSKGEMPHKFAHVPMQRSGVSAPEGTNNMADAIRQITAVNARGRKQKITSLFKDLEGNPMQGRVAVGRSDNPLLNNLVKYQKTSKNEETGKTRTTSTYINYRTISENGKPWVNPGYSGLGAFSEAEKDIQQQIDNIIKTLL